MFILTSLLFVCFWAGFATNKFVNYKSVSEKKQFMLERKEYDNLQLGEKIKLLHSKILILNDYFNSLLEYDHIEQAFNFIDEGEVIAKEEFLARPVKKPNISDVILSKNSFPSNADKEGSLERGQSSAISSLTNEIGETETSNNKMLGNEMGDLVAKKFLTTKALAEKTNMLEELSNDVDSDMVDMAFSDLSKLYEKINRRNFLITNKVNSIGFKISDLARNALDDDIKILENFNIENVGVGGPFTAFEDYLGSNSKTSFKKSSKGKGGDLEDKRDFIFNENFLKTLEFSLAIEKMLTKLPFASPMIGNHRVSSKFGKRRDPINGRWAYHKGIDYVGKTDAYIHATAPGKVVYVGPRGDYGNLVEIQHDMGFSTLYAHLKKMLVKKGQYVNVGAKIGIQGSTGRSTGPHLHYEARYKNKAFDPVKIQQIKTYVYKK